MREEYQFYDVLDVEGEKVGDSHDNFDVALATAQSYADNLGTVHRVQRRKEVVITRTLRFVYPPGQTGKQVRG